MEIPVQMCLPAWLASSSVPILGDAFQSANAEKTNIGMESTVGANQAIIGSIISAQNAKKEPSSMARNVLKNI